MVAGMLMGLMLVVAGEPPRGWPLFAMDTARGSPELLAELGYSGQSGTLNGDARAVLEHRKRLLAQGLRMNAVYCGAELTAGGLKADPALAETMAGLADSGTVIWIHINSKAFKPSDPAGDTLAVEGLKKLAREAGRNRLKVALYPHSDFWVEKTADAIRVSRLVDEPNLGLSLNVCHALNKGEGDQLPRLAERAGDKLFVVTVSGAKKGGKGWGELILPLDAGDMDLAPLLGQLALQGYKGEIGFQGYGIAGDRRKIHQGTMETWKRLNASLE